MVVYTSYERQRWQVLLMKEGYLTRAGQDETQRELPPGPVVKGHKPGETLDTGGPRVQEADTGRTPEEAEATEWN
jgi:hypothetical protein